MQSQNKPILIAAAGLVAIALSSVPIRAHDATPFREAGVSHVIHLDEVGGKVNDINIETYVPQACAERPCPLVVVMHGLQRRADQVRDAWIAAADRHGLLIAAPHFDRERFPTRLYQQGGVQREPDKAKWIYATIERFFDKALASGRVKGQDYVLYGHSAGAQFAHRMALLMPEARFSTVVSANAGYYTLPGFGELSDGRAFPFSLTGTPASPETLRRSFAKPMLIMLGDQDNDPLHEQLNKSDGANAQGAHRFARGQNFAAVAARQAASLGAAYNWRVEIVPGVGHEQAKMADAAGAALFGR